MSRRRRGVWSWQARRRGAWALVAIALGVLGVRFAEPWAYLFVLGLGDKKDASSIRWPLARLRALGSRAVGPAVTYLQSHESFAFPGGALLDILRSNGEPARQELRNAIQGTRDPLAESSLIYALQMEFGDYEFLLRWPHFKEGRPVERMFLEDSIRMGVPVEDMYAMPHMETRDGHVSKEFWSWYRAHAAPHGPFPPLAARAR
jgi:hypothetical protein